MKKRTEEKEFIKAKRVTIQNLEEIKFTLDLCTQEGMLDLNAQFHNDLLDFLEEAHLAKTYPELLEVITQAKLVEMDIDAWLSRKGKTTISHEWPSIPPQLPPG